MRWKAWAPEGDLQGRRLDCSARGLACAGLATTHARRIAGSTTRMDGYASLMD